MTIDNYLDNLYLSFNDNTGQGVKVYKYDRALGTYTLVDTAVVDPMGSILYNAKLWINNL